MHVSSYCIFNLNINSRTTIVYNNISHLGSFLENFCWGITAVDIYLHTYNWVGR